MAVSITHTTTRSVVGSSYRVADVVTATAGIDDAIYVFAVGTNVFARVASVGDIQDLPDSESAAVTAGVSFYRQPQVTRDFTVVDQAQEFSTLLHDRIQQLVVAYNDAVNAFVGVTTETLTSS